MPGDELLGEAEEREDQGRHGVLHSLDSALGEDSLELHEDLEVEVGVGLVINQVDKLGNCLLALFELVGLLRATVLVVLEERHDEVD